MSGNEYAPPPGPPPSQRRPTSETQSGQPELQSTNPWRDAHTTASQGSSPSNEQYAPPPGPPPSHQKSEEAEPPPYDPWLAVPDNALLPPPPAFHEDKSPVSNAPEAEAQRAHAWCDHNPLWIPRQHNQETHMRISRGDINLTAPPNSRNVQLSSQRPGKTRVKTDASCSDTILLSDIPLYTGTTGTANAIYFEVHIISLGGEKKFLKKQDIDGSLGIGFVAPPYPSWRQPGWHRASLGVHSDDGRRYIDDSYGGEEFTRPFKKGDVVGIGMVFSPPQYSGAAARNKVDVVFTRNGKKAGAWDLHEDRDQQQDGGSVVGLEGGHDILAAVGVYGAAEFEVRFKKEDWAFKF